MLTRAAAEILEVIPISATISYGSVAIGVLSEVQLDGVSAAVTEVRAVSARMEAPGCELGRSAREAVESCLVTQLSSAKKSTLRQPS